ncbi:hypothetical protein LCDVSa007R [Lymphocystis disease virus 3]|uniref:Uncharacterized protein n=1 Tax=Lymphocystis disease virus 3 TaxID=2560566 RepID=A0A1B2RVR8_9VIRU|nr:hypothetical protein BZK12_gp007 [Lymphocystis disease virus Sa]AOC55091.1 hypothetical protein LCDVSa007R [Lymphocystis disease virus 3]
MPESFVNICHCKLTDVCKTCLIWLIRVRKRTDVVKNIIRVNTERVLTSVRQLIENDDLDVEFCSSSLKKLLSDIISQNKPLNRYKIIKINTGQVDDAIDSKQIYSYFEFVNTVLKYCDPSIFSDVLNETYTLISAFEQINKILQSDYLELNLS